MAENLREIIAKRLASSQQSKTPVPTVVKAPNEAEVEDDDSFDDDDEIETEPVKPETKVPTIAPKKVENNIEQEQMEAIYREIEMLQNNGRFRVELLHQLNEINKSLSIVSNAIIDIVSPNEK